jgi:hypothetical protein
MRRRGGQPAWTDGSHGRLRKGLRKTSASDCSFRSHYSFFLLVAPHLLRGTHPDICAQHDYEGGEFLTSCLTSRGGGRFLLSLFCILPRSAGH